MDKSWINQHRLHPEYIEGVKEFVKLACQNNPLSIEVTCPCKRCRNVKLVKKDLLGEHLMVNGFLPSYTRWIFHGEDLPASVPLNENVSDSNDGDEVNEMIYEGFGLPPPSLVHRASNEIGSSNIELGPDKKTERFFSLLKEAERELYPECHKFSTLSFVVRLLHIKCLSGWSDKSFTMLLKLLKDAFPKGETLPKSFYATRALLRELGLDYHKVHACPRDCSLYWKETASRDDCIVCQTPRYKQFEGEKNDYKKKQQRIPQKIVRYFPLIPRLQRLFMSSKTASLMRWHVEGRIDDGKMRHPADSPVWKNFDTLYPKFASEPRNVRLGLAADGFNPFKAMNVAHSSWPVIVMPYNLPPWLCMKQPHMMMILLIDGPSSPGNNIDVYLRLLVDELNELWENGVQTYDAETNQMFQLHAVLLWTINDFPAYANLSGWSTKGAFACPCCNIRTRHRYLKNGRKICYMGHRRWLNASHKFRKDGASFDGTFEFEPCPTRLSGANVLRQLGPKHQPTNRQKRTRKGKEKKDNEKDHNWRKRSIFFELPYWEHNLIRHNLDVMHIEKNVCDNVLWTILNVDGKGKDNLNARRDLQDMGIRKALHPKKGVGNRYYLPPACFAMNNRERGLFCTLLKNIKVPDGYASNISRRVNLKQHSISGLKSHDNHILMQQILPIAVRNLLPKKVVEPLIELSNFFRQLCSKTLEPDGLDRLQSQIALTLCHLERIFPPSFFDIMEHLPIHLAEEAKIAGPVQYRWMYFIESMTDRRCSRQRQHSASANSESSYSGSADESSYSGSSDESSEESTRIIPDPPMSWYPPGSLPSASSSTGSTHDTTAGHSSRGPTLMHGSDWNPSGGILHIVPNELNQVVDGYTPLASRLGVLARDGNLMPLTYRTWSHVPKENKERIWREVKVNTDADESMKKFVLASVGKKWREWKARVKQMGYTPFDNDADRLTHRPERVHEHQWRSLVYYWGTRKAQKKSTKNKEIRKKKTLNHITGRKPFSVVRVEETNKKNGVPATRLEVWMAGYSKDNKPSNDKVAEVMTQMKDLGAQSSATDEEIITQVLGPERPGRVRTYGLGPSPTDVFGGGYRQSQEQTRIIQMQVQEQLNQYKAQMEMQMKEMMDAMLNQQKVQMEMQGTIQAQQARIEQLESQQAMGGPVAPATTHVHSQQQSHAYTSSFNCHRSSEEVHISKKEKKKKKK